MSALVRLADPGDETTSECCAAALYLFFCHPAVLALIDGREVPLTACSGPERKSGRMLDTLRLLRSRFPRVWRDPLAEFQEGF